MLAAIAFLVGVLAYRGLEFTMPDRPAEEPAPVVAEQPAPASPQPQSPGKLPAHDDAHTADDVNESSGTVQRGDTASSILGGYLTPAELHDLTQQCKPIFPLRGLAVGQPYALRARGEELVDFEYEINGDEKLSIKKTDKGFEIEKVAIKYDVTVERVRGAIDSSLFESVAAIGESPEIAVRMADIFAWDIDFIRDLRQGDTFTILVEKRSREGQPAGYGRILAARFVNQGQEFFAFFFEDEKGFGSHYDASGRSLRKAFLKAPLDFKRISSGFTMSRLHPVLKIRRPHPGIDYAAPTGTPVKAVGDGTVLAVKQDRAAGKYIKMRHVNGYETSYMHLNGWARGLKQGARIRQGQVIGYVGSTGLATGPHLDFRMKKNGAFIDPRKVQTPAAESISKKRMSQFKQAVEQLRHGLGEAGPVQAGGDKSTPEMPTTQEAATDTESLPGG